MKVRDTGNRMLVEQLLGPSAGLDLNANPTEQRERSAQLYNALREKFVAVTALKQAAEYQFTFQLPWHQTGQCIAAEVVYRDLSPRSSRVSAFLTNIFVEPRTGSIDAGRQFMSVGASEKMEFPEVFFSVSKSGDFASDVVNLRGAEDLGAMFLQVPEPKTD